MIVNPKFAVSGSLPPPGPIGRLVRLLTGSLFLAIAALAIGAHRVFWVLLSPATALLAVAAILSLFALPDFINVSFGLSSGRRPQWIVLALGLAVASFSLVRYGSLWAPPTAMLTLALVVYSAAHLGISLVLAGIFAVPGCELRAMPNLVAHAQGREAAEHL